MEAADALLERAGVPHKTCAGMQAALKTLDDRNFEYPWNCLEEAVAAKETRSGRQVIDNDALPHPLYAGLTARPASLSGEKDHPEVAQEPALRGK